MKVRHPCEKFHKVACRVCDAAGIFSSMIPRGKASEREVVEGFDWASVRSGGLRSGFPLGVSTGSSRASDRSWCVLSRDLGAGLFV
jgi:hypothetical protein